MKKFKFSLVILGFAITSSCFSQENISSKKEVVVYSFFLNIVPEHFNFPLIGFINIAKGSHQSAQIGFINWNQNNFKGVQTGFINTSGGFIKGAQIGFINTCGESLKGSQIGFKNANAKETTGAQIGFINLTKKPLKGFQLGFINYADTVSKGIQLGLLSIVNKGGYEALEVGISEMYPVNVSFKIGVKKLYTSVVGSYNSNLDNPFALGLGLGSILPINNSFFLNPEFIAQNTFSDKNQQIISLTTNLGYNITKKLEILTGPSLVWQNNENSSGINKPLFQLSGNQINANNRLIVGFRFSIRYDFSKSN